MQFQRIDTLILATPFVSFARIVARRTSPPCRAFRLSGLRLPRRTPCVLHEGLGIPADILIRAPRTGTKRKARTKTAQQGRRAGVTRARRALLAALRQRCENARFSRLSTAGRLPLFPPCF